MSTTAPASGPTGAPPSDDVFPPPASRKEWRDAALRSAPNIVVFTLLGGVLYLGHHTGWKLPKLSTLLAAPAGVADDWCSEHLVPESQCVECNLELLPKPKDFGFCRQHGVNECVICHPELAQVAGEPRLPSYDTAKAITVMSRPENNSRNMLHKGRVQFASKEAADKAGLDVDVVQERPMSDSIAANGELLFNPTRVAHLSVQVPGMVAVVYKTVGDDVLAGDTLALVDAARVGQAKSQLLHSIVQVQLKRKNVERIRSAGTAIPGRALIDAEAKAGPGSAEIAYLSARQSLVNLGFDLPDDLDERESKSVADDLRLLGLAPSQIETLPVGTKTANLISIRAPYDGVVVASDIVVGEVVDSTKVLFTVADPKKMWLTLHVRQEEAKYVTRDLPVRFFPDDGSNDVTGKVSWISPAVDARTRTLQVRVSLDNRGERLRSNTFGTGRIVLRNEPRAIVVPREAVHSTSDAQFVFVRDRNFLEEGGPKVFHVRQVRIGARDDRYVELLAGVLPGEVVATKGSPVLLAQLLRSNLGAGCGCHAH